MSRLSDRLGLWLAHFLTKEVENYRAFSVIPADVLYGCLHPGDVLLVDGNERISVAIKFLTQSTWSHAALFVGNVLGRDQPSLIEADVTEGVVAVPIEKYANLNTRICRPVGLTPEDQRKLVEFALGRLGDTYDLRNIFDLARYLIPAPSLPASWRRNMLTMGSGDPTRAICSTLIAQAFQSVAYPILPQGIEGDEAKTAYSVRHHSLYTPRDFDLSPYFATVKPTIEAGFDHRTFNWKKEPERTSIDEGL